MYLLKKKIGTKFWIMLLALTILISAFTMPVFAAGQSKEVMPSAKQEETLKNAPISLKEIEEPIPNPQYQYYLNHKEEFTYGYIPPKYILPQEKTRSIRTRAASPVTNIRKYDSRSSDTKLNHFGRNVISPRKNQFNTGTCWAQANLAVVESLLKIKYNQDYDLSEGHMAYNVDNQTNLQSGGLDQDALAYYARLTGPVLESNYPAYTIDENDPQNRSQKEFDPSRANLLPANERDTFKILGDAFNKKLDFFVTRTLEIDLTLENLKKCIYENGSVPASYFITYDGYNKFVLGNKPWDGPIVKSIGVRYHYIKCIPGSKTMLTNHAVEIIGWDDDMKVTNSKEEKATGAFLVKNSIPAPPFDPYDDFRGYHWISYESFLGKGDIAPSLKKIITPREVRPMDPAERASIKNVYNPCKLTHTIFNQKFDIKGNLNKAINVYERGTTEPETIKYVTYYNKSEGSAPYKIYITEDPELLKEEKTTFADGTKGDTLKDINSDKWVELASGTFTEKGYQTLEAKTPYTLTSDKFALKIETDSKTIGLSYRSFPTVEKVPASSYMYNDENPEHFFQKIDDAYKIFLGTVTVKANEYTVTVSSDTNGTATADLAKGPKGTKVNLKAEPNPGYEFDKWEVEGARVADPQAPETILTIGEGDASAKAIFKEIPPTEYTASLETDYGTKPDDQKIKEGEKAKVPQGFEKDTTEILDNASGKTYVFKGWFEGTEEYNFESEVKEDKTLTAKWEEKIIPIKEYTVSFETAYGTKPDDQTIKEGEKAKVPQGYEKDKTEILDNGKTYVFKGWFIGTEEYNFETEVKEDKTLTAKWEEKIIPITEYTVSFETAYGTKPADQTIKEGEKAKVPQGYEKDKTEILDSASGKIYVFKGWFIGTEEYNFEKEVREDKALTAKWEEKIIPITEYTVSFETDYGRKPEDQKIKEGGKAKAPTGFEKDTTEIKDSGKTYVFKGWFIGTEEYNFESEVKEDKTLTAKWEEKIIPIAEYTVTISSDTNGTATADPAKGQKGTKVTLTAQANPGYEFDKWEVSGAIVADPQAPTTTLTIEEEDVSALASFKKILAKKILDVEDDKIEDSPTVGYIKFVFDARSFGQIAGKEKVAFEVLKGTSFKDPNLQKKIKEEVEGKLKSGDKEFIGWSPQITKDDSKVEEGAINDKRIYTALYKEITPPDPSVPKPQDPQPQIPRIDHHDYYEYEYYPFYKRYNEDLFKLLDTNSKIPAYVSEKTIRQLFLKIGEKEYRDNLANKYQLEVAPIIKNNRTLLPARAVAEILGTKVDWDNKTRTASFTKGGLVAKIQIDGNKIVLNNGKTIEMDAKPLNIEGRILIPLTNLANALGIDNGNIKDGINQTIEWDEENKTVIINIS